LRQVIDALGPPAGRPIPTPAAGSARIAAPHRPALAPDASTPATAADPDVLGPPGGIATSWKAGIDAACLWSPDILTTDTLAEVRQTRPGGEYAFAFVLGRIGLDYTPESPLETANHRADDRLGLQTHGRLRAAEPLTLVAGAGAYDGYMDYRSLWLDEHFRQLYGRRPNYALAKPRGWNLSGGARWEYWPACGFAQGEVAYQSDVIAPGYGVSLDTFPPQLLRYRDAYDTLSGRLTFENVLTPRLRALQEFQIADTTDRQLRFSLQSSLNWALAESWVARLVLAGTTESPQFDAGSAGLTVERDWNQRWFISLLARYYRDTGEVVNALLPDNTAAPPLETVQIGLGLRWQGEKSSIKLVCGPYFTRYTPRVASGNAFAHLYADRDWFWGQVAYAREW
jgi:hypothetical protein